MSPNVSIEVGQDTAEVLRVRAAELGVTVPHERFPDLAARVANGLVGDSSVVSDRLAQLKHVPRQRARASLRSGLA